MSCTSGSKYSRAPSSFEAGSFVIDHITTLGWFLSRATSSRSTCAWAACAASPMVSGDQVLSFGAPVMPPMRPRLRPTAGVSSITTMPWRSAKSMTSSAYG